MRGLGAIAECIAGHMVGLMHDPWIALLHLSSERNMDKAHHKHEVPCTSTYIVHDEQLSGACVYVL